MQRTIVLISFGLCRLSLHAENLTTTANQWQPQSPCYGPILTNNAAGSLTFAIPVNAAYPPWSEANGGCVGYLTTGHTASISSFSSLTIVIQVDVTGAPQFVWDNDCNGPVPVTVRPFFEVNQRNGGSGKSQYDRWWANTATSFYELDKLVTGQITITVPLTGGAWSSVQGVFGDANSTAANAFVRALNHPNAIGMTFGGGGCFGHGTQVVGGAAQFTVVSYSLNP